MPLEPFHIPGHLGTIHPEDTRPGCLVALQAKELAVGGGIVTENMRTENVSHIWYAQAAETQDGRPARGIIA